MGVENNNNNGRRKKYRMMMMMILIMTELTQESSLDNAELECNAIDDEDDKYDNNIVIIPTQVLFKMKRNLKWKSKRKQKRQKERYSRKVKIANMITNATKEYPTSEEDVRRDNVTKGILKTIDRRSLTKKKRVPNQWSDHPT